MNHINTGNIFILHFKKYVRLVNYFLKQGNVKPIVTYE